jgi:hypothetical protein
LGDTKPDHKIKSFNELIKVLDSYNWLLINSEISSFLPLKK